jgi:hypothetical protein
MPPVLDPRSATGASERSSDTDDARESGLALDRGPAEGLRPSQAETREAPPPSVSRPRPSSTSAKPTPSAAPAPTTPKERAKIAAWVAGPALAGFLALSFAPSVTAPLGHAMRGDSPLASGVLAVLTLVGAAALAAKSVGTSRSFGMLIATIGAVLLGIVMIIVTFSASETADIEIPPAAGSIVPFLAPIVPFGLALAALQRARSVWGSRFHDEQTEAKRFLAITSLLLLVLLELGPFGAVRAAARTRAPAPPAATRR